MNIVVAQPLHYPAQFVAYGTKPAVCYGDPRFLGEYSGTAFDAVPVIGYDDLKYCGIAARYTACVGAADLVVVYPDLATPHGFVKYDQACFAFTGTLLASGTFKPVPAERVVPVTGCSDPACLAEVFSGTGASSQTLVYFTATSTGSQAVGVLFDHLDTGTACYGVCPRRVDDGLRGLSEGSEQLVFTSEPRLQVMVSGGTGALDFAVTGANFQKRLVVSRSGMDVTAYGMPGASRHVQIQVQPLDAVYLDASASTGRLNSFAKGAVVSVEWMPVVALPRLYDTGTLAASGSLVALGFCGLVPSQTYTFFGTLPADVATEGPVNPDTLVTVQGSGGTELVAVRVRGAGDAPPGTMGLSWYGSQSLGAPILFRFYAAREIQGQHGEMDVWLSSAGTFPGTFSLDPYRAITRTGSSTWRGTEAGDLRRGSLEVQSGSAAFFLPGQYHGPDGHLRTFHSTADTMDYGGTIYARVKADPGLSFDVIDP